MNTQVVFITGALTGIGRAVAVIFSQQGAHVLCPVVEIKSKWTVNTVLRAIADSSHQPRRGLPRRERKRAPPFGRRGEATLAQLMRGIPYPRLEYVFRGSE